MMKKVVYVLFLIFVTALAAMGQKVADKKTASEIRMIGRALNDSIMLRWAPTTAAVWNMANKYGYVLERYTIMRDDKLLDIPERKLLTASPMKPWPLNRWEPLAKKDDYAQVAAEALYSQKLEVTNTLASNIIDVMNKAKEDDMRFSFALFAADLSVNTAKALGLYFADKDVKKNERYLYRLFTQVPKEKIAIDTAIVYLGVKDFMPLPKLTGVRAEFGDKVVMISWEGRRFETLYNSFIVERSDDGGKTFHSIADEPIINTYDEGKPAPERVLKMDSIDHYNIEYQYRVKGHNPFGEISPPSDVVSGVSHPALKAQPEIIDAEIGLYSKVKVTWKFPEEDAKNIEGFKLQRAPKDDGAYIDLVSKISFNVREALDPSPLNSNYYRVIAYDRYGNETQSGTSLVMLIDSIPPSPPVKLNGKIDSTGIVTIRWERNKEPDIFGYRVLRANFVTDEFTQISFESPREPVYIDTVSLNTLTKKIYYKVVAIDKHFNPSGFSEPLELTRPDIIPPVSPVFQAINSDEKGIHLEWISSSSDDVVKHVLYRRSPADAGWVPIYISISRDTSVTFIDSLAEIKQPYAYTLIAVDDSGLESPPAKPVTMKRGDSGKRPEIKYVNAQADRTQRQIKLSWSYRQPDVSKFFIYRAEEDQEISLYKIIDAPPQEVFNDKDLKTNTVYHYRLQAEYSNGALSPISKELTVNY